MAAPKTSETEPKFWRDAALPFIEARSVQDGRKVCYGRDSHETLSIGVVSKGRCHYLNSGRTERIGAGTVVLMNPGDVHACNPIDNGPWGYSMLYFDVSWACEIQRDLGVSPGDRFVPFAALATHRPELCHGLNHLFATLIDPEVEHLRKHSAAIIFMTAAQQTLGAAPQRHAPPPNLARAAQFIRQNCTRSLKLEEICAQVNLSASHLIRSFKGEYGLTPHSYQINCRIEFCRARLRQGREIAEVALEAGFSDQAHLQRLFKKFVAATPGQYRA